MEHEERLERAEEDDYDTLASPTLSLGSDKRMTPSEWAEPRLQEQSTNSAKDEDDDDDA